MVQRAEALSGQVRLHLGHKRSQSGAANPLPASRARRAVAQPPGSGAADGPPEAGPEQEARTQGGRCVEGAR